jgi:periplasmic protein TonB
MPSLTASPNSGEDRLSAIASRSLRRRSLLASAGLHLGIVALLLLIALWDVRALPEEPVVRVTLLAEGPGAAGAAGGAGGERAAAGDARADPTTSTTTTTEPPPSPAETAPQAVTAISSRPPRPVLPAPPRRKPEPPHRTVEAPAKPRESEQVAQAPATPPEPEQVAQAPAPEPAAPAPAPGTGSGLGVGAGRGTGAEGAGHGAIGDGPIEGPGDDYLDRLRRWLNRYKHYPPEARKDKEEGGLTVSFVILRDGTVLDVQIEHSSGFPLLDQAALQMLHDASPVPPLPPNYRPERIVIDLPVRFSIGFLDSLF